MPTTLKFEFTLEEANVVLNALAHRSFLEVHQLIQKINQLAAAQTNPSPQVTAE